MAERSRTALPKRRPLPSRLITRSAARLGRLPLTGRGLAVGILSAAALRGLGYGALDLVALTLGLAGLGVVAASALGGLVAHVWLRGRLARLEPPPLALRGEAGIRLETGFRFPRPRPLPLLEIRWDWATPAGVSCRAVERGPQLCEQVRLPARTQLDRVSRRFEVGDVFGFWRFRHIRDEPAALTMLPSPGALRRIDVVHSLAGGEDLPDPAGSLEGDRLEIRRYAPGDPVRMVLWKAYARTRELYVRTPERSVAEVHRTLAYLVVAPGDEPAAAALRVALETGVLGDDWVLGVDGTDETADDLTTALALVARSGRDDMREQPGGSGLEAFIRREGRGVGRAVVFVPAREGEWLDNALAGVAGLRKTRFVVAADGVAFDPDERPLWRRALYASEAPPPASPERTELGRVIARIAAGGHDLIFVDRRSGRASDHGRLRAARMSA